MIHWTGMSLLIVALALIPVFRGGNADWPPALLALSAALSLVMAAWASARASTTQLMASRRATLPLALWFLWLGWQIIQLIPLPAELLEQIAPYSYSVHQAIRAVGAQPVYRLSTAPLDSLRLLQWSLAYFTLYLAVLWHVRERRDFKIVLIAIAVMTTLQAMYGALHEITGFTLSLLDPANAHRHGATGSFPNRNHFAAYLVLGAATILALLLGRPGESRQTLRGKLLSLLNLLASPVLLYRMMLIALVVGVVLSRSRMGNTSLAIGLSVLAVIWLLQTRKSANFLKALLIFGSIAVVDIALISERFGIERVLARIESTDLSQENRTLVNQMSLELLQASWPQGAGMGSYVYLQEGVRPAILRHGANYAHNDFLQLAIEAGALGAVLLAALFAYHLLLALRNLGRKRLLYRAYAASFCMVSAAGLLHATVEFNFYIPAYAATLVVLMALMQTVHATARSSR